MFSLEWTTPKVPKPLNENIGVPGSSARVPAACSTIASRVTIFSLIDMRSTVLMSAPGAGLRQRNRAGDGADECRMISPFSRRLCAAGHATAQGRAADAAASDAWHDRPPALAVEA